MFDFENGSPLPGDRFRATWGDVDEPPVVVTYVALDTRYCANEDDADEIIEFDELAALAYTDQIEYLGRIDPDQF